MEVLDYGGVGLWRCWVMEVLDYGVPPSKLQALNVIATITPAYSELYVSIILTTTDTERLSGSLPQVQRNT